LFWQQRQTRPIRGYNGVASAKRNTLRRFAPVWPKYAPTTLLKTHREDRSFISVPKLRAAKVLPQPGGPKKIALTRRVRPAFNSLSLILPFRCELFQLMAVRVR
jgi:hypothetical protein